VGKKIGRPDWAINIEELINKIEKEMDRCSEIEEETYKEYAEASYRVAQKKYGDEIKLYQKAFKNGYVIVDTFVNLPFKESAGLRLSKFFKIMREESKIYALRCFKCKRVIFPPRPMCGFCRITVGEKEEDWIQLRDTGTITSIVFPTEREVDRATGKIVGEENPCAFIRLDGGDEWTILVHYLEKIDSDKLHRGMRVKAVWKPEDHRHSRMSDIAYFKIIQE
jgi:uncharacterized OB-fold protein